MLLLSYDSPTALGLIASVAALLYFFLMTISPNLPPAIIFSAIIGYFVYTKKSNGVSVKNIALPKISAPVALEKRA